MKSERLKKNLRKAFVAAGCLLIALAFLHEASIYPWDFIKNETIDPTESAPPHTVEIPEAIPSPSDAPLRQTEPDRFPEIPAEELASVFTFEERFLDDEASDDFPEEFERRPRPQRISEPSQSPASAYVPVKRTQIGQVTIDALNVSERLFDGNTDNELHYGFGHLTGTALPGKYGNCVVSAHRTSSSGMEPLRHMDKLQTGDKIVIEHDGDTFTYELFDMFIVAKEDTWVLYPDWDTEYKMLTLVTCDPLIYPGGNRPNRLIGRARLVSN